MWRQKLKISELIALHVWLNGTEVWRFPLIAWNWQWWGVFFVGSDADWNKQAFGSVVTSNDTEEWRYEAMKDVNNRSRWIEDCLITEVLVHVFLSEPYFSYSITPPAHHHQQNYTQQWGLCSSQALTRCNTEKQLNNGSDSKRGGRTESGFFLCFSVNAYNQRGWLQTVDYCSSTSHLFI